MSPVFNKKRETGALHGRREICVGCANPDRGGRAFTKVNPAGQGKDVAGVLGELEAHRKGTYSSDSFIVPNKHPSRVNSHLEMVFVCFAPLVTPNRA